MQRLLDDLYIEWNLNPRILLFKFALLLGCSFVAYKLGELAFLALGYAEWFQSLGFGYKWLIAYPLIGLFSLTGGLGIIELIKRILD